MKPVVAVALQQKDIEEGLVKSLQDSAEVRLLNARSPRLMARALSEAPPDVLVIESGPTVTMELVDMVLLACPATRIVLYAPELSEEDAAIVERGIYFYAVGASAEMLADVARAALKSLRRKLD